MIIDNSRKYHVETVIPEFAFTDGGINKLNYLIYDDRFANKESMNIINKYLKNFDDTSYMFVESNLSSVLNDFTFDCSNLTSLSDMFRECTLPSTIYFNNTENITNTTSMFYGCSIAKVNLFDTSNVTNMENMFYGCSNLTTVPLFDTSNVIYMGGIFRGCSSLKDIPLFDTSNVTSMPYLFYNCTSLKDDKVPSFDTTNVTNMSYMFYGCNKLTTVPLYDTTNVTNMSYMFYNCTSLTTVPSFDTTNVKNMSYMFYNCTGLTSLPDEFTIFNLSSMSYMFYGCKNLTSIPRINLAFFSSSSSFSGTFDNCTNLESVLFNEFNSPKCFFKIDLTDTKVYTSSSVDSLVRSLPTTTYGNEIVLSTRYGAAPWTIEEANEKGWVITQST